MGQAANLAAPVEANVKANPARVIGVLAGLVLVLALVIAVLALDRGGDILMIGLGLVLAATSMELFRRAVRERQS